jgi:hypothetical protein
MIVLLIAGRETGEPRYDANPEPGVTILTWHPVNGAEGDANYAAISVPAKSSAGDLPRRVYRSKKQRACSRSEG